MNFTDKCDRKPQDIVQVGSIKYNRDASIAEGSNCSETFHSLV